MRDTDSKHVEKFEWTHFCIVGIQGIIMKQRQKIWSRFEGSDLETGGGAGQPEV